MRKSTVKRNYRKLDGIKLENKAEGIETGIYGNASVFVTPTITNLVFSAAIVDYSKKRTLYEQGGIAQKLAYTKAKNVLMTLVDGQAEFVESIAVGDITIIKMAGFDATFDPDGSPKPGVVRVDGISLERLEKGTNSLVSDCGTLPKGNTLVAILCEGFPLPSEVVIDSDGNIILPKGFAGQIRTNVKHQRRKYWRNLTSGVHYYVYYIAITAKGISLLSLPVSELCG